MKKLLILLMAALVITACKKDDDDDDNNNNNPTPPTFEEQIVGTYQFISATFNQPITMTNNGTPVVFAEGDDAYLFVGEGLLGSAPCDNADNAAMEMRADFTAYYACLGEDNEAQMGTWEANEEAAVLTLNMTNPLPFSIPINNVTIDGSELAGDILQLPVPIEMTQPVGVTNMQMANVAVVFNKVD
jgi:hypothetical protein